jgi:hypothetical protein
MKRNNPDRVQAGQIWLDEDGDHSIVLTVSDGIVEILVMTGERAGQKYDGEDLQNFAYKQNIIDAEEHYFLECLK